MQEFIQLYKELMWYIQNKSFNYLHFDWMVFEFKISLTAKKSIIEEIEIPKLLIALIEVTYVESKYVTRRFQETNQLFQLNRRRA